MFPVKVEAPLTVKLFNVVAPETVAADNVVVPVLVILSTVTSPVKAEVQVTAKFPQTVAFPEVSNVSEDKPPATLAQFVTSNAPTVALEEVRAAISPVEAEIQSVVIVPTTDKSAQAATFQLSVEVQVTVKFSQIVALQEVVIDAVEISVA